MQAIRRDRPLRLVLDLGGVHGLDPINVGTLAAACHLGDDHHVVVFLGHPSPAIADQLLAAGVPTHRLRHLPHTTRNDGLGEGTDPVTFSSAARIGVPGTALG